VNNGGLYGERAGWYLPGYPDDSWATASVPAASALPGTSWYRTTFRLHIPAHDDASLGITIGDPSAPRSPANYRALIFVNGWNMGQYVANVGPQHTFVVPNGVLDPHGENTLAIAVTSDGGAGNGLERVSLTDLATVRGGVPLTLDDSPGYAQLESRLLR
jgi:Beta-galactosidase jelly roll domain